MMDRPVRLSSAPSFLTDLNHVFCNRLIAFCTAIIIGIYNGAFATVDLESAHEHADAVLTAYSKPMRSGSAVPGTPGYNSQGCAGDNSFGKRRQRKDVCCLGLSRPQTAL
jgi:hypothetical protein